MHKSTHGNAFWEHEKESVIDLYINQHLNCAQIARKYDCWETTVLNHLKTWGIPIRTKRHNAKYHVDSQFFHTIDNENKAYYLGLLFADGHVSKNNDVMLTLQDLDIIEKFKDTIHSDAPIKQDRYGNYAFIVCCKEMCDDLRSIGFTNRKSYDCDFDKILQSIPQNLLHHFVRGMFDGDGSIKIYRYSYLRHPQYHFGYTGLPNVVEYIKQYFDIKTKTVIESDNTHTCVSSCRETIKHIYFVLYKNATIYMKRKYETFQEII